MEVIQVNIWKTNFRKKLLPNQKVWKLKNKIWGGGGGVLEKNWIQKLINVFSVIKHPGESKTF